MRRWARPGKARPALATSADLGLASRAAGASSGALSTDRRDHDGGGRDHAAERHGRHRYYRLAGPGIVEALEALAAVAPPRRARSFREAHAGRAVRFARTCYDHLAGRLGVQLTDALVEQGWLVQAGRACEVTPEGRHRFAGLGIDVEALRTGRRAFARACLDWSERRYHLAGALGAAICARLIELGWLERIHATRAVRVTNTGRRALRSHFDVTVF